MAQPAITPTIALVFSVAFLGFALAGSAGTASASLMLKWTVQVTEMEVEAPELG
jgi:hypothetical protein